jgi:IS5 family transposase
LFALDERYRNLSEVGDPLMRLKELIDFELFRPALAKALRRCDGSKGGRPPYDAVLMFKVLILQTLYTLSDDATEFQIRDRFSFMRFLGLELQDAVPDAKTIWLFREQLRKAGAIDELFASFDVHLKAQGYLAMSGQIVDATIVAAPRQRTTEDEKQAIKEGRVPEEWKDKPKKLAQKDRDARWTLKRAKARPADDSKKAKVEIAIPDFGYKNHVSIDRAHGFVRRFAVTSAAAHVCKFGFDPSDNVRFRHSSRGGYYRRGGSTFVNDGPIGRPRGRPSIDGLWGRRRRSRSLTKAGRSPNSPPRDEWETAISSGGVRQIKSRFLQLMMARACQMCSIRAIPQARYGRTPPIARRPTSCSWKRMAS